MVRKKIPKEKVTAKGIPRGAPKKRSPAVRVFSLMLALVLIVTGISFPEPVETEAATTGCSCLDGSHTHRINGNITDWCKKGGAGWNTILKWGVSDSTTKNVHLIQKDGSSNIYIAWYQKNKKATNPAHYSTVGFHLTGEKYTLGAGNIAMGNASCKIMEGSDFNVVDMGYVPGSSTEIYSFYYVKYSTVIDMCEYELGGKDGRLREYKDANGRYYKIYLQPYISCWDKSGSRRLKAGSSYDTVYAMFCTLYSLPTQQDLKEKYNVPVRVPINKLTVVLRYWNIDEDGNVSKLYNIDGNSSVVTDRKMVSFASLNESDKAQYITKPYQGIVGDMRKLTSEIHKEYQLLRSAQEFTTKSMPSSSNGGRAASSNDSWKSSKEKYIFSGVSFMIGEAGSKPDVNDNPYKTMLNYKKMNKASEVKVNDTFPFTNSSIYAQGYYADNSTSPKQLILDLQNYSISMDSFYRAVYKNPTKKGKPTKNSTINYDTDKLYFDVYYVKAANVKYEYKVTRTVSDYDEKTGKFKNSENLNQDLVSGNVDESKNITDDKKFTLTIGSSAHPNYAENAGDSALGSVIKDDHKYILARSVLKVTDETGDTEDWHLRIENKKHK